MIKSIVAVLVAAALLSGCVGTSEGVRPSGNSGNIDRPMDGGDAQL